MLRARTGRGAPPPSRADARSRAVSALGVKPGDGDVHEPLEEVALGGRGSPLVLELLVSVEVVAVRIGSSPRARLIAPDYRRPSRVLVSRAWRRSCSLGSTSSSAGNSRACFPRPPPRDERQRHSAPTSSSPTSRGSSRGSRRRVARHPDPRVHESHGQVGPPARSHGRIRPGDRKSALVERGRRSSASSPDRTRRNPVAAAIAGYTRRVTYIIADPASTKTARASTSARRLHPRVRADPDHRSGGVHRLRGLRTGVPGRGDLPGGRSRTSGTPSSRSTTRSPIREDQLARRHVRDRAQRPERAARMVSARPEARSCEAAGRAKT